MGHTLQTQVFLIRLITRDNFTYHEVMAQRGLRRKER